MGYRSSAENVIRDLSAYGISDDDLHYLLPTHVHLDHAGSCGTLARRFPTASILSHPRGEPHLIDPARLVKGATEIFQEDLMQRYGAPDPISNKRVRSILDDEQIALGNGVTLRAVWTPGHAPHHLSYFLEGTNALFTGDAVGVYRPGFPVLIPTTPPPSFNLELALESLDRLIGLTPVQLLTPHYGLLANAGEMLEENVGALLRWRSRLENLASNKSSIEEVLEILTVDICKRIGGSPPDLPDSLRTTLRVSVLGFLGYLERSSER
jgi:glyoxylase-like metal-dependent hydrolase (beta-lactamase superfamily II)